MEAVFAQWICRHPAAVLDLARAGLVAGLWGTGTRLSARWSVIR